MRISDWSSDVCSSDLVQAYVAEKSLGKRIHLLGVRSDVPNLLAGFDLFALATRKEASGTVFVEAGAAGLPVVGTRVDGVPELMQDGVSGILVPREDQEWEERRVGQGGGVTVKTRWATT